MSTMSAETNYTTVNKDSWNKRTEVHLTSQFYDVKGFLEGNNSLMNIELALLGDISGKSILHLQCHFGQDTISFSRLGAEATGVDLSDRAIDAAKDLAEKAGTNTQFICCDIYDLLQHLDKQFDIVFTSYGTIGWLPDMDKWAGIISRFLKPGGRFIFAEFHPVVWMFDYQFDKVAYNYFKDGAIIEDSTGTYGDDGAEDKITFTEISWNHSISEVLNALIKSGLEINSLNEYDYSPYNCFKETVEVAPKKFRIKHLGNKIPMVYSISATKKN